MRTQEGSGLGLFGWGRLLAILGLMFCLVVPSMAGAQGIKGGDDDPTEEATEEATEPDDNGTDEPTEYNWEDFEDVGMTAEDAYESPQFGYTVEWSRDWGVDAYYLTDDGDPDVDPVMSDENNEQDLLYLIWGEDGGEPAYVIISGQSEGRGGPDADVEEWTDPDYIADQWADQFEAEALLDDTTRDAGAVLYSVVDTDDNDAQYYTVYQSIEMEDGSMLYLTFSAYEDWFEDAYTSWSEDVEIDGQPVDVVFTWEDIADAI
jgi:hypothetical protein